MSKLIFFDLDGTLIDGYVFIYQHLWEYFGVDQEQPRSMLRKYLAQKITYPQWVENDIRLLREAGATKEKIIEAIGLLQPMMGATETIAELRRRGHRTFVVSGGIDLVLTTIFPKHADMFDEVFINRYYFGQTGEITRAVPTKYDIEHKATCIKETAAKYNMNLGACVFVGDNFNDIQAAFTAGVSIAFNAKSDELVQASTHHVESSDLRDILPLIP